MAATLCVLSCENFRREVEASVAAEGWSDVAVAPFPARCGRPPLAWDEVRGVLPESCSDVLLMGRACLRALGEPPAGFPPVRTVPVQQCFHLVAGETTVSEALAAGAYLVTPAWVADWQGHLRAMGFAPDEASALMRDFAAEIVLLDTGIDDRAPRFLAELGGATGLPVRRVTVGLDHARQSLSRLVLEWRLAEATRAAEQARRRHATELADHVAAMDVLAQLAKAQDEPAAVAAIDELFQMLFAPGTLHYVPFQGGEPAGSGPLPDSVREALAALSGEHALTPDGQGFAVRIGRGAETLGVIVLEQFAFPAWRDRYLNLALAVTGVCGLAIENARNRRRLLETEKLASLAIVVAGVAHEVNTPLGVVVTAASELERQSRQLAERFAARTMTQSDLRGHLDQTATGTGLILRNAERIGKLVDAFRQVAVSGTVPEARPFRLRACVEDVVLSFTTALSQGGVAAEIDCDPALEIISVREDWITILRNLVANSLQHAFGAGRGGTIAIGVAVDAGHLRLDYRDDGAGMPPGIRARIFDPFFTTDMQHGMGLGMHLVHNLVTQRFGGGIRCDSEPGSGTRFRIDVPLPSNLETPAP